MKRITLSLDACVETLALLISIAWADGKVDERERSGVQAAAKVLNLTKELRERLDTLLEKPIPVDEILVEQLGPKERAFAFVAATWMTGVDDNIDPKEVAMLDEVATLFEIENDEKQELARIARDLEPLRKKDGVWADELITLFKAIPPRLESGPPSGVEVVFE